MEIGNRVVYRHKFLDNGVVQFGRVVGIGQLAGNKAAYVVFDNCTVKQLIVVDRLEVIDGV